MAAVSVGHVVSSSMLQEGLTKPVFSVVIQNDFDTSEITVKTDFVH
jgi:hypothetical protein